MGEIESLEVKLKANTSDIDKKIQGLVASVGKLESTLKHVGNLNTTGLVSSMQNIGSALTSWKSSGADGRTFTSIANGLDKIAKVDSAGLQNASIGIESLSKAISGLNGFTVDTAQIVGVSKALTKFGSASMTTANQNLAVIGSGVQTFVNEINQVGRVNFDSSSILAVGDSIARLGSKNVTNATMNIPFLTTSLRDFINTMNQTGGLTSDANGIVSLANAISRMGSSASNKAITNIPLLADSLKKMMTTLKSSPRVSQNIVDMTNALANLSSQGNRMVTTTNRLTSGYNRLHSATRRLHSSHKGLASTIGKMYARFWMLFRVFRMLGNAINYASDLTEVQNVIDNTFGLSTADSINKNAEAIEALSKSSIEYFGMSELTTKTIAGQFEAMANAMGLATQKSTGLSASLKNVLGQEVDVSNMSSQISLDLTALAGDMASFYNVESTEVASALQSGVMSGQARALRRYGMDLTQATLQEYALSKGITEEVKNMTQAEKTMLRYQYVMERSSNVQGDFLRTSGKLLCVA